MESLRLALRGLRWRTGPSVAVLVVAVIAMAGAALGPLYAASAQDSLVRESLAKASAAATAVQSRGSIAGQTQYTPTQLRDAVAAEAVDPALDPWYLPGSMALTVRDGSPYDGTHRLGLAQVSWYRGQCEGITLVEGACPGPTGEAMVSTRFAAESGVPVGSVLRLGITSDPAPDTVTVVGIYDGATYDPAVWGLEHPSQAQEGQTEGAPDRLDEILVSEGTMLDSNGDQTAISVRRLDAAAVHLDDLPALRSAVVAATQLPATPPPGPRVQSLSGLPDFLDSLQPQLDAVSTASFAVTAQLVLLAWFVLFLVVAATSDERAGEIALAKLRGMSRRATLMFGLAEPVLLIVAALPLGLALAWAVDVALVRSYLVPGTSVTLSPMVVAALVVCLLGGVVAAALAARGILTAPVLEQLRRTGGRRARLVRSSALDAAAVALAVAAVYELQQGGSDALSLLAPGLIALAVGLLAVRVLPALARVEVARTRASSSVASFLASRNVARRPTGLRVVVLLTLAVGLAVFAVDGWTVAAANRIDAARAEVGAAEVLHVRASSPGALQAAVVAADPSGTQALAAVATDNGQGGLLAVDATRLGAVASWDPAWAGTTRADVSELLHPAQPARPIPVSGRIAMTVDYDRTSGDSVVDLVVTVRAETGLAYDVRLGRMLPGTTSYDLRLVPCTDAPCSLASFTFRQPIALPATSVAGDVVMRDVRDADGPIDLGANGPTGWRSGSSSGSAPVSGGADVTASSLGSLSVHVDNRPDYTRPIEDSAVQVADHPLELPLLWGEDQDVASGTPADVEVVAGLDGRFTPATVVGVGVLPRLLGHGSTADLTYALAAMGTAPDPLDYQVWLSPTAGPQVREALGAAGIEVVSTESLAQREAELARSGPALALRLFLFAAGVALVLGAGTLLANAYVVVRRRAYELAALRALGASRAVLVRSARREQVVLALTGTLLGAFAGLLAAAFALPVLLVSEVSGPPPWFGPAWLPVAALLVAVLLLLVVVSDVGARRTVRRAVPDLLRQVQE